MILTDGYPPHDRGGAERIAFYHARAMRDLGWDVAVFCSYPAGQEESIEEEEPGIRVYRSIPLHPVSRIGEPGNIDRALMLGSSLLNPFVERPLSNAIADFRPDLLHAHYIVRISQAVFARVAPGVPRVVTYHGYQFECPKGGLFRHRRNEICVDKPLPCRVFRDRVTDALTSVDRIVAICRFIERRLLEAGHARDAVRYVPNGVPSVLDRARDSAAANRDFLYVGRMTANKGISELITAFKRLNAPDSRLVLVGDGEYRAEAERVAGDDRRVVFVGWQNADQVSGHYQAARAVVVPSLWHEVMNTVICEAQSWWRPVIVTRVGGNADLVVDGESGFVCEPGDVDALTDRMQAVLDDDSLCDRLAEGGYGHVRQFTMDRHVSGLMDIYSELLSSED